MRASANHRGPRRIGVQGGVLRGVPSRGLFSSRGSSRGRSFKGSVLQGVRVLDACARHSFKGSFQGVRVLDACARHSFKGSESLMRVRDTRGFKDSDPLMHVRDTRGFKDSTVVCTSAAVVQFVRVPYCRSVNRIERPDPPIVTSHPFCRTAALLAACCLSAALPLGAQCPAISRAARDSQATRVIYNAVLRELTYDMARRVFDRAPTGWTLDLPPDSSGIAFGAMRAELTRLLQARPIQPGDTTERHLTLTLLRYDADSLAFRFDVNGYRTCPGSTGKVGSGTGYKYAKAWATMPYPYVAQAYLFSDAMFCPPPSLRRASGHVLQGSVLQGVRCLQGVRVLDACARHWRVQGL